MTNKFIIIFLLLCPMKLFAEQVVININAQVLEKTCSIVNNNIQVDMNLVSIRDHVVKTSFGKTPFSISLNDCPKSVESANIKFNAISDLSDSRLIKNTEGVGYASGIALALFYNDEIVDISNNNVNHLIDHGLVVNDIKFDIAYFRTENNYIIGKVLGIIDFEISYN